MYHVPATRLARLAAESVGLPIVEVNPAAFDADEATDSSAQGDRELAPLESALAALDSEVGLAGVTAGAVESEYQTSRIRGLCGRLGLDLYAPLWGENPHDLAGAMLDAGFDIRIIQVAARGLDESWLGRPLDREALGDLEALNEAYGVHVLGEGGEFETVVVDGPHMDRRIELEYETRWEGSRGSIEVTDAWLAPR